jgi:hypothetical protein
METQYRSFDKPQHLFRGAAEKDGLHIIGIAFTAHDDHLGIVLNRFPVDFHTRPSLADYHWSMVVHHIPFIYLRFSRGAVV